MIKAFTDAWLANQSVLREKFAAKHPDNYMAVVRAVVEILANADDHGDNPDPRRIHEIDDGGYNGALAYVIGASGYERRRYWCVKIRYGTCSQCDTLKGIHDLNDLSDGPPNEEQVRDYMTLAMHIVQGLREMDDIGV